MVIGNYKSFFLIEEPTPVYTDLYVNLVSAEQNQRMRRAEILTDCPVII